MTAALVHPDNDALLNCGWSALPASYRMPIGFKLALALRAAGGGSLPFPRLGAG